MNEQDFKNRIEERWERHRRNRNKGRVWMGAFLLIIGGLLLAKASGVIFPAWFFTWPMLLIAIGLVSGIRHGFRGFGWLIPIGIGGMFLADRLSPDIHLRPYLWPIVLIALGLFIIFRPRNRWCRRYPGDTTTSVDTKADMAETTPATTEEKSRWEQAASDRNDSIDATAVFGGVKKNILNKNFKGGDVTTFMGGAEINLMQADFNNKIKLDCFNMFGGTKLIIPPDWDVQSDVVTIFGGIEDKRPPASNTNTDKVLYLDGTCIFGGIEIRSY